MCHQCPGNAGISLSLPPGFTHCALGQPECEEFQRLVAEAQEKAKRGAPRLRLIQGGLR
jgi:hypothetical protein